MARLTVEDCLSHIDNRFDLVLVAARRARKIAFGAQPMVSEENDKPTVIALREIADGLVNEHVMNEMDARERAAEEYELAAQAVLSEEMETPPPAMDEL